MRLTKSIKEGIKRRALANGFSAWQERLVLERHTIAMALHEELTAPYKEAIAAFPKEGGWLNTDTGIYVNLKEKDDKDDSRSDVYIYFGITDFLRGVPRLSQEFWKEHQEERRNGLPVPETNYLHSAHRPSAEMRRRLQAHMSACAQYEKSLQGVDHELECVLSSVTTLKRLSEVCPGIEEFCPKEEAGVLVVHSTVMADLAKIQQVHSGA